jgi:ribonuclease J
MEEAGKLNPRALILEGTNVNRTENVYERDVLENGLKAIKNATGLVIADFPPRDVYRLLTFLDIAKETGRKLAILPRDAYLLKTMRLLDTEIPDIAHEPNLVIYQDTIAGSLKLWAQNLCKDYGSKMIVAEDVHSAQDNFILCFSFFDINELPSIQPVAGSLYVFSSSEPHDEEQEIDFGRLHRWLDLFKFSKHGLPVEIKDNPKERSQWEIPEAEKGLHASGHACGPDLLEIARQLKPEVLIPVHSEHPEFYLENLADTGIEVMLPNPLGTLEI